MTATAGVITAITFTSGGAYTVVPTNPVSVTGGTGTGATFNITAYQLRTGAPTWNITNAGSGYVEQPTVTFSGGGGSGAAAYATVGGTATVKGLGTNLDFSTPNGTGLRVVDGGQTSAAYWSVGGGVNAVFRTVGNAAAYFDNNNAQPLIFRTQTSVEQFRVASTASAVNYVQVTGAATNNIPVISAQGSDSNITLRLAPKGTGTIALMSDSGSFTGFGVQSRAPNGDTWLETQRDVGAVNLFAASGAANGDIRLIPKGTGLVRFGTRTASADAPITGYIEIKDSGGTTRRLAVIG